jgi:hypothetical protein
LSSPHAASSPDRSVSSTVAYSRSSSELVSLLALRSTLVRPILCYPFRSRFPPLQCADLPHCFLFSHRRLPKRTSLLRPAYRNIQLDRSDPTQPVDRRHLHVRRLVLDGRQDRLRPSGGRSMVPANDTGLVPVHHRPLLHHRFGGVDEGQVEEQSGQLRCFTPSEGSTAD